MLTDEEEARFRQLVADLKPVPQPSVARAVWWLAGAGVLVICAVLLLAVHALVALASVLSALGCLVKATNIVLPDGNGTVEASRRLQRWR